MPNINEKTNIPLFAVLISLPVLVGSILWLSSIESKADKALELGSSVKSDAKEDRQILKEMHDDIIEIKHDLKISLKRR